MQPGVVGWFRVGAGGEQAPKFKEEVLWRRGEPLIPQRPKGPLLLLLWPGRELKLRFNLFRCRILPHPLTPTLQLLSFKIDHGRLCTPGGGGKTPATHSQWCCSGNRFKPLAEFLPPGWCFPAPSHPPAQFTLHGCHFPGVAWVGVTCTESGSLLVSG